MSLEQIPSGWGVAAPAVIERLTEHRLISEARRLAFDENCSDVEIAEILGVAVRKVVGLLYRDRGAEKMPIGWGMKAIDIGDAAVHIARGSITVADQRGEASVSKNGRRVPAEILNQVQALADSGLSNLAIASRLGIHPRTVRRYARDSAA